MFDRRLYRSAFLPLLVVLLVAAFSLADRPAGLTSTLTGDGFDGVRARAALHALVRSYPRRRPGSFGDQRLAALIAASLAHPAASVSAAASGTQQPPFAVAVRHISGQTIDGQRRLETVIATRAGTLASQIVILAHRDAASPGSPAELSGTAALLELGRVLAGRVTQHTITLVSVSGGSGGNAGAADFAAHPGGPVHAIIALGDLAGSRAHRPFVVPWSDAGGSAPDVLQRTVQAAIAAEVGTQARSAGTLTQFVHLAAPLTPGEQGVLLAHGLPAVLMQVSGEVGPSPATRIRQARLQNFGRAALRAINALDAAPTMGAGPVDALVLQDKTVPAWAVRLLVGMLLLPALLATVDAFARVRRRHEAVGRRVGWVLACGAPFLLCGLLTSVLGALGLLGATPPTTAPPRSLPVSGAALVAIGLTFAVCCLSWPLLVRALEVREPPRGGAAGVAVLLVLDALALGVWVMNPFAALLLVPAVHLWLVIASPELRPRPALSLMLVLAGLLLPVAVVALYARHLALGPLEAAWAILQLVAGGQLGVLGVVLCSATLGCALAITLVALRGGREAALAPPVTVRGPSGYAGPGSLGGTESALRR